MVPTDIPTDAPTDTPTDIPTLPPTGTPLPSLTPTTRPPGEVSLLETDLEVAIDAIFIDFVEVQRLTGLQVGIVMGDEVAYAKGFGVRNTDTQEPVTPESLFHMASISKPFVATGIMPAVEEGKIDLDEPVVTYLPYFKLADERYSQITVQQILSHVSGMPDVMGEYGWDQPEYDDQALERYVRSLEDREMLFDPGDEFSYSNMAYEVMGDVIAKVSGQTFEEYMQENIFTPLEMENSTFFKPDVPPELATSPHYISGSVSDIYPYNRDHGPARPCIPMCWIWPTGRLPT